MEDCLQPGSALVAAGYMIYGSSTMLVYTSGSGVHGFTLDPMIGEFLLTHPNIHIPENPKYYSVNHGNETYWSTGLVKYTHWLQGIEGDHKPLSLRYIGSLVGDFHRTLLSGGVFYYPSDSHDPSKPHGKLRLTYEASPLAFIALYAGGYASDGHKNILDLQPTSLHQRTPLFIGDKHLVEKAEEFIQHYDS
jgi:fructose-1,6-bisphosphatase I